MVIIDDTGTILLTNAETERMFGCTHETIAAAGFNGYIQKPIDVDGFIEETERLPAHAAVATGG